MDKTTGSIVPFMSQHPELGRLDGMDIYADDTVDGIHHWTTLRCRAELFLHLLVRLL